MRHFIGSMLIGLAGIIRGLNNALIFMLLIGIGLGIFMFTLLAFMDLVHIAMPVMNPEYEVIDVFKKPVWSVVVFVLGSATMWLGIQKMYLEDKKERKKYKKNFE